MSLRGSWDTNLKQNWWYEHTHIWRFNHFTHPVMEKGLWNPWWLFRFKKQFFAVQSDSQQAPDVYVTSGWRWTWRQRDVAFWLKMKIGLTSIWRWLNVGFWLHNLKTTKFQRQLTSVLDINLTLTLDVGFTLNFGHPTSQPKCNQISTSFDVVCLFCACWVYSCSRTHASCVWTIWGSRGLMVRESDS